MAVFFCQADSSGTRFKIHLSPRASKEAIGGLHGDAVKVRVKAPPVDGRANEALLRYLAGLLGVSRSRLEILSGETSRDKLVKVDGVDPEEVSARLAGS
ncbi:MAG: DUF167 domain-containing protein [Pseudomonadota bacterium]